MTSKSRDGRTGLAAPGRAAGQSRRGRRPYATGLDGIRAIAVVCVVLYHAGFMKENLIGAMFTGVKHLPAGAAAGGAPARFASPWLALVLLLVAAFAVYLIVKRPF